MIQLNDLEVLRSNDKAVYNDFLKRNINPNLYLSIIATNNCQLKCPYCINSNTDRQQELPLNKALKNIKKAKDLFGIKECVILGGEPTLYSDLNGLIDGLRSFGFEKICLTTNGIKLKEDFNFINHGITHLNISIHNENGTFKLSDLLDFSIKSRHSPIKIRINTNVYRGNHDNLFDLIEWLQLIEAYNSCDSIRVSNIIRKDNFSVNTQNDKTGLDMILSDEEYNNLFDVVIAEYSKHVSCIDNPSALGFVDYTLIPDKIPIIINRNINSKVSEQVCENSDSVINTVKCLVSGDISLSWNKNNIINL